MATATATKTPTPVKSAQVIIPDTQTLSLSDRCDRCAAQAFVRVDIMVSDKVVGLLFCGHHYNANEEKLVSAAEVIVDERKFINAKSESST